MTDRPPQNSDSPNKPATSHAPPKLQVSSQGLLLSEGSNKRLAEIRKKFHAPVAASSEQRLPLTDQPLIPGLPKEIKVELEQARKAINDKISRLMDHFPHGKKHKMFTIRFGPVEQIPAMSIRKAFRLLGINGKSLKMSLIGDLDYCGNNIKADRMNHPAE